MLAMTEEADNLTLQHLRQIRTEMQEGFAKLTTEQALTSHKIWHTGRGYAFDAAEHRGFAQ